MNNKMSPSMRAAARVMIWQAKHPGVLNEYIIAEIIERETRCDELLQSLAELLSLEPTIMHDPKCAKWQQAVASCSCGLDGKLVAAQAAIAKAEGAHGER